MALNKSILKSAFLAIMDELATREDNPEDAREYFATKMSDAVYEFVKSGEVHVTVTTTGTAAAQTGTGTGTIS